MCGKEEVFTLGCDNKGLDDEGPHHGTTSTCIVFDSGQIDDENLRGGVTGLANVIDENLSLTNNTQVVRVDGYNEIDEPAPSVSNQAASEEDINIRKMGNNNTKCNIDKRGKLCLTHGCSVNIIEVTSRKWQWLPRKKEFGNTYRKVKKFVCKGDKLDDNLCDNPANSRSESELRKPDEVEVERDKSSLESSDRYNPSGQDNGKVLECLKEKV